MSYVINTMTNLANQTGFAFLKPGNFIMVVVALIFLYLAIVKQYEPLLLVPMQLIFWQSSYSFQIKQQQRSPSSEEPMDQLLFSLQENLARQLIWDQSRWRHILICP